MVTLILYAIAIGSLATIASHLIEKCCISFAKPARGVWIVAIAVAVIAPTLSLAKPHFPSPNLRQSAGVQPSDDAAKVSPVRTAVESEEASAVPASGMPDQAILLVWLTASVALALALITAGVRTKQLIKKASPHRISNTTVLVTEDVGPAVVGTIRYQILLPRWALSLPQQQLDMVVSHERQHARTFDPLLLRLAAVGLVLFPWNAFLWYMMRRLQAGIEFDCDRRVLNTTDDAKAYMSLLVDVGERASLRPSFATSLSESPSQLHRRIAAMTTSPRRRIVTLTFSVSAFVFLAAAAQIRVPSTPLPTLRLNSNARANARGLAAQVHSVATVNVSSSGSAPVTFIVYPADSARVGQQEQFQPVGAKLQLTTPATFNADMAGGDVHVMSVAGEVVKVSASFVGSPATAAEMASAHVVLLRGGTGVRSPESADGLSIPYPARNNVVLLRATALAHKLEPRAFDKTATPSSSVIGLLFDVDGRVIHHSRISIPDTTELLRPLFPRLFPDAKKADDAPYQIMALLDGAYGGWKVELVAVYLADPRKD